MRKSETIVFLIISLSFLIGIFLYPQMPRETVSHWGIQGEVNGYLPKFWGLFLMVNYYNFFIFAFYPHSQS